MERVRPHIVVFADPIFHFGPSQYAGAFRARLRESCRRHDYTICIPFKYFGLFTAALPELRTRTVAIPFQKRENFNFELDNDFSVKTTANILTLLMMPLATHFAHEVCILGCDGRPAEDNTYFWGHNPRTQINDKMENIRDVHPGFFAINYDDYYREHCETLEAQFSAAEQVNKEIISLGHSYIPALRSRTRVGCRHSVVDKTVPVRRIFIVDPDGKNHQGHYMAYNDKLVDQFEKFGAEAGVLCRRDIEENILQSHPNYFPLWNSHSWEVAENSEISEYGCDFQVQIERFLNRAFLEDKEPVLLYLYCGSLEHALILDVISLANPKLRVHVNLFYCAMDFDFETAHGWKPFFQRWDAALGCGRFVVTMPTSDVRDELAEYTGCVLPVALHPSTAVSDDKFTSLRNANRNKGDVRRFNVLFPGTARPEKGYSTTFECVAKLTTSKDLHAIVRYTPNSTATEDFSSNLESAKDNVEMVTGVLSDQEFDKLFERAHIVVLPYSPEAFAKRTSGLLIDSVYHGAPCIVVKGTWLAKFVDRFGCGIVVPLATADLLANAVRVIADSYATYRACALSAATAYFSQNSWSLLADSILGATSKQLDCVELDGRSAGYLTCDDRDGNHPFGDEVGRRHIAKSNLRFQCARHSLHYDALRPRVWRYKQLDNAKENFWFLVYKVAGGAQGKAYSAGITIKAIHKVEVQVTLARFGNGPYEAFAVNVDLEPDVAQEIRIDGQFEHQHSSLKIQVRVIGDISISCDFLFDSTYVVEDERGACTPVIGDHQGTVKLQGLGLNACGGGSDEAAAFIAKPKGYGSALDDSAIQHFGAFLVIPSQQFKRTLMNRWRFEPSDAAPRQILFVMPDLAVNTGDCYFGCLTLKSSRRVTVLVSLARHGDSEWDCASRVVTLAPNATESVKLFKEFSRSHYALRLQVDVLDFESDTCLDISFENMSIYESLTSIRLSRKTSDMSLQSAEKLFQQGKYRPALGMGTGPLVSVVMPSLNQMGFIGAAIDSVLGQNYPHLELIVADGGSTDGTLAILNARCATDGRLRWATGKDTGPAQAINSALTLVRGTVVGWLNSDDLYTPGAIARAVCAFDAHPNFLMVYGQGEHIDSDGRVTSAYPSRPPETPMHQFVEGCFICQPTVFFKRSLFVLLGKLDESLKTAFDFDYWLRAFTAFPDRIGFIDAVQAQSRLHEGCITLRNRRTVMLEGMQLLAKHLGVSPQRWVKTYADELASSGLPAAKRRAELASFLSEARPYLSVADFLELVSVLGVDGDGIPRLTAASSR